MNQSAHGIVRMLYQGKVYIIGISVSKKHITINPFSGAVLELLAKNLSKYTVNKKTFSVPLDWKFDEVLVRSIAKTCMQEFNRFRWI